MLLQHPLAQQPVLNILNQDFHVFLAFLDQFLKTLHDLLAEKVTCFWTFFRPQKMTQK
jgi:hypothetical protein